MSLVIAPATVDSLTYIGRNLRAADCVELGLPPGADAAHVLLEAAESARWCHVGHVDGVPTAAYGVNPIEGRNWGSPWLLATAGARRLRRPLLTVAPGEVELMLAGFPFLTNAVHDRHHEAIRWLIWLGFRIDFEHPERRGTRTFLPFWKGNPHV